MTASRFRGAVQMRERLAARIAALVPERSVKAVHRHAQQHQVALPGERGVGDRDHLLDAREVDEAVHREGSRLIMARRASQLPRRTSGDVDDEGTRVAHS
jgi:hypothetical protein